MKQHSKVKKEGETVQTWNFSNLRHLLQRQSLFDSLRVGSHRRCGTSGKAARDDPSRGLAREITKDGRLCEQRKPAEMVVNQTTAFNN